MIQTIKMTEKSRVTIFGNGVNSCITNSDDEWVEVDMPQEATHVLLRPGLEPFRSETRIEHGWGEDMDTIADRPWVIVDVHPNDIEAYDPHYEPDWCIFCREDLIFLRPG